MRLRPFRYDDGECEASATTEYCTGARSRRQNLGALERDSEISTRDVAKSRTQGVLVTAAQLSLFVSYPRASVRLDFAL